MNASFHPRPLLMILAAILFLLSACQQRQAGAEGAASEGGAAMNAEKTKLPDPNVLTLKLTDAIRQRRSVRGFQSRELTLNEISTLFWSCQGLTDTRGLRAAPSAGATYPLEVYVATPQGVFRYLPQGHQMTRTSSRDVRHELAAAGLGQEAIAEAPAVFVITGVLARTQRRYGARAERYVFMEMGHAAQNLHLAATSLGLGSVPIGAFQDEEVARVLNLPGGERPGYLIPVGQPR